ncbi:helix-turn-helix transcriptional regulator [Streptomyces sp. B1-3]|uniref:helix-turn-helix transcriptional regulator n=1 Tax=Streptomyces sp. B1-3 TaxID=3141453 RepID=UPI003D27C2D2
MAKELWSPEKLAEHLDVPVKTIYGWNYKGTGPKFSKVGRHVRYRPQDVEAWLDQQQAG